MSYAWNFCITDVSQPLHAADFLRHFALVVDVKNRKLINPKFPKFQPDRVSPPSPEVSIAPPPHCKPTVHSIQPSNPFQTLLSSYPAITTTTFAQTRPKHLMENFILTEGPPVHSRARRFSPEKLASAKAEFEHLEDWLNKTNIVVQNREGRTS